MTYKNYKLYHDFLYIICYCRFVVICTGEFGIVYKGVYNKNGVPVDVAIKTIKSSVYQLN